MADVLDAERLTLNDVADRLGVHLTTVWRWALTGVRGKQLSTVLVGGRRYVLKPDLDAFLAQRLDPDRDSPDRRERQVDAARILDGCGIKSR